MHADKDRIRIDKIEFDVPSGAANYMNLNRTIPVMRAALTILSITFFDDPPDIVGTDLQGDQ
jgi:hypothetical protein